MCLIGEDCARLCSFFHVFWRATAPLVLRPVAAPDDANFDASAGFVLLFLLLPTDRGKSSENMGSVIGEEARPLLECNRLETVEAVSEIVSLLLEAGLFLLRRSST